MINKKEWLTGLVQHQLSDVNILKGFIRYYALCDCAYAKLQLDLSHQFESSFEDTAPTISYVKSIVEHFSDNNQTINCECCRDTDYLLLITDEANEYGVRFDVENRQIDFRVFDADGTEKLDESIDIKYCPFCGRVLDD